MTGMILKIILAGALGAIIGLEREFSHKEAGFRTNILIAMGSALISILSLELAKIGPGGDPARLSAQIITGIGFIGAGAIIQARFTIHGLTTAATVWTVAAIGIAVGSGYYLFGFIVTLIVVLVLTSFRYFSKLLERQNPLCLYLISTEERAVVLMDIKKVLTELNIKYQQFHLTKSLQGFEIEIIFSTSENKNREFVERVIQLKGVNEVLSESL